MEKLLAMSILNLLPRKASPWRSHRQSPHTMELFLPEREGGSAALQLFPWVFTAHSLARAHHSHHCHQRCPFTPAHSKTPLQRCRFTSSRCFPFHSRSGRGGGGERPGFPWPQLEGAANCCGNGQSHLHNEVWKGCLAHVFFRRFIFHFI